MNLSHFRFLEWLILENAFYRCGANVCICEKQTNTFMCELFFSCILKYSYKNRKRSLHFRTYESFFNIVNAIMTSRWRHNDVISITSGSVDCVELNCSVLHCLQYSNFLFFKKIITNDVIIDDVISSRKVPFSELIENEILPIGFNFFGILMRNFRPKKFRKIS